MKLIILVCARTRVCVTVCLSHRRKNSAQISDFIQLCKKTPKLVHIYITCRMKQALRDLSLKWFIAVILGRLKQDIIEAPLTLIKTLNHLNIIIILSKSLCLSLIELDHKRTTGCIKWMGAQLSLLWFSVQPLTMIIQLEFSYKKQLRWLKDVIMCSLFIFCCNP